VALADAFFWMATVVGTVILTVRFFWLTLVALTEEFFATVALTVVFFLMFIVVFLVAFTELFF